MKERQRENAPCRHTGPHCGTCCVTLPLHSAKYSSRYREPPPWLTLALLRIPPTCGTAGSTPERDRTRARLLFFARLWPLDYVSCQYASH